MRVLVTGGRTFASASQMHRALDAIHAETPVTLVIQGGADGADRLARAWATGRRVAVLTFHADWSLGRKAGPIRNRRMIEEGNPDLVVAFEGGKGTADCCRQARAAGVVVRGEVGQ